jgi:iron complex transport system ATP-binding protein
MTAAIVCEQLDVKRGDQVVLRDVNVTIGAIETVALIGPNGAGKTTLLLALLGLLRPSRGVIRLDQQPLRRLTPRERGRFAAYVPQNVTYSAGFTVYDVVAGGRFPHTQPLRPLSSADQAAINAALEIAGLLPLAERPITELSGGERQKAFLAAAIAQDAQMMMLDEPTTALDPAYQVELVGMLNHWRDRGRGLVIVSHDLQLPAVLGGRVLALKNGRLVRDAPAAAALDPTELAELYGNAFENVATATGRNLPIPRWPERSQP